MAWRQIKILLSIVFAFLPFAGSDAFAQAVKATIETPFFRGKQGLGAMSILGNHGQVALVEIGKEVAKAHLLDSSLRELKSIDILDGPWAKTKFHFLGSFHTKDDLFIIYLYVEDQAKMLAISVDFKSGSKIERVDLELTGSTYIGSFSNSDFYTLLAYDNNGLNERILVSRFSGSTLFKTTAFEFPSIEAKGRPISKVLFRPKFNLDDANTQSISPEGIQTITDARSGCKIYNLRDSIVLSYDKRRCHLWQMDMHSGKGSYQIVELNKGPILASTENKQEADEEKEEFVGASNHNMGLATFLDMSTRTFFLARRVSDKLEVNVRELNDGKLLSSYVLRKKTPTDSVEPKFLSYYEYATKPHGLIKTKTEAVKSVRYALDVLDNGLTLAVNPIGTDGKNFELTVGSYNSLVSDGLMIWDGSIFLLPFGFKYAKENHFIITPLPPSGARYVGFKIRYFKKLWDKDLSQFHDGEIKPNFYEKFLQFQEKVLIKEPIYSTFFPVNNYYVFGCYSPETNHYQFFKLDPAKDSFLN